MANFTLRRVDLFPSGTSVEARKRTLFGNYDPVRGTAPPGAAEQTVVSDGVTIPFVGLTDDAEYVFSGQVGGVWKHTNARTTTTAGTLTVGASRIQLGDTRTGHGPMVVNSDGADFGGVWDAIIRVGYNAGDSGNPILPGEPFAAWVVESDFKDADTVRTMEMYGELRSSDGLHNWRPWAVQAKRTAPSSREDFFRYFVLSGKAIVFNAMLNAGDASMATFNPNAIDIWAPKLQNNTLQLHAALGSGSSVALGHNAVDGVFVMQTDTASQMSMPLAGASNPLRLFKTSATSHSLCIGGNDNGAVATFCSVGAGSAAQTVLVARAGFVAGTQTGDLVSVQDSTNAILSRFNKAGYFMTRKTVIPADADLVAGELAIWLDSTNGAAKAMFKAKQADGTVRTAAVALA